MAPVACDHLVPALSQPGATRPDGRKRQQTQDAIQEAALGAWAVLCPPSPSCLAYPRTMRPANGRSHAHRLCGMGAMPWEQPSRTRRAPLNPAPLWPVVAGVDAALERAAPVGACRPFAGPWRLAGAGTASCSSRALPGDRGSQRPQRHGPVPCVHHGSTPVIVAPGTPEVMALAPECSTPPAGQEPQDGAQVAATRWMARQAGRSPHVTLCGDALYGQHPWCAR
jgi:hypothetical protein